MLVRCVWFCSYLCKVCSHVSEALLLVLWTLSLSFPTNNPSSDSKAFLCFTAFSGSPTAVHCAFLSSMRRHGHSHKLISSRAPQYYTPSAHTFLRRIDLLHSIACTTVLPLWAYLSEPLVKDSHKRSTENTIPCAPSHVITHYHYVLQRGIRKHCM